MRCSEKNFKHLISINKLNTLSSHTANSIKLQTTHQISYDDKSNSRIQLNTTTIRKIILCFFHQLPTFIFLSSAAMFNQMKKITLALVSGASSKIRLKRGREIFFIILCCVSRWLPCRCLIISRYQVSLSLLLHGCSICCVVSLSQ